MSNYTWACFSCHVAVRRDGQSEDVRCPNCSEACECIGYKIPIPPKSKPKEWEKLSVDFHAQKRADALKAEQKHVRKIRELEQEIARFEAMPENPGRKDALKQLKKKLKASS